MASSESAMAESSKPLLEIFSKGVSDVRSLVTCKICTRYMYEPFTTKCGHTFCYACLSKWLGHGQRKRQCPDCRTKIKEEPCPNYTIRDIVNLLINNAAFIEDEDSVEELQAEQRKEADDLERDRTGPDAEGLFHGLFDITYREPIQDAVDGVMRCPRCTWEVEDFWCENCQLDFGGDGDFWAEWSDDEFEPEFDELSQEGPLYEDDYDSDEPDEEDEAFIDDGDVEGGSEGDEITPTGNVGLDISDDYEVAAGEDYSSDVDRRPARHVEDLDGFGTEDGALDYVADNDNSSQESADATTDGDDDSDGDSEADSTEDDSEDEEDDDDDDEMDSSATDSDDEPIVRGHRSQRRSVIPFRQARSRQRNDARRPATNVIDLTNSPNDSPPLTRRQRPTSSRLGLDGTTADPIPTGVSRSSTLGQDREAGVDSGSDSPIPIRRRKRERVLLSDSEDDDDALDVQRETRAQRRRLNQQLPELRNPLEVNWANPQSCRAS